MVIGHDIDPPMITVSKQTSGGSPRFCEIKYCGGCLPWNEWAAVVVRSGCCSLGRCLVGWGLRGLFARTFAGRSKPCSPKQCLRSPRSPGQRCRSARRGARGCDSVRPAAMAVAVCERKVHFFLMAFHDGDEGRRGYSIAMVSSGNR